jgi:hypothetical protein
MRAEPVPTAVPAVEECDTAKGTAEQHRLATDLQCLRDLLERDRVEEARRFVKELEQRWPESERVRHYVHVLAPPIARSRPDIPPRSREREWKWLAEHGREYPGCWLAVHEDRLIAADPDRRVVVAKAREILGEEGALLFDQPLEPKPR